MVLHRRRFLSKLALAAASIGVLQRNGFAGDPMTIRIAVQKTGTVSWELDVIRRHGLDKASGIVIETVDLAAAEGGRLALRGGSADVFVTDWLWVARERALGEGLQFVPYSTAVGAIMVPSGSSLQTLSDLRGRKLAVSGGPLDKSWLLVRAAALQQKLDLKGEAVPVYGAPPLLYEKMLQGEVDAALSYWNFAARLEAKGYRRLYAVEEATRALGAGGPLVMIGYVFQEDWARRNPAALAGFLDASAQARRIMATDDAEWQALAPLTLAGDAATLAALRDAYRAGIPRRTLAEEEADAARLFGVLAELGGEDLVGSAKALDPGTFYKAPPAP